MYIGKLTLPLVMLLQRLKNAPVTLFQRREFRTPDNQRIGRVECQCSSC